MKRHNSQAGFSIPEVLVAVAIVSGLLLAISATSKVLFDSHRISSNSIEETRQSRLAMDKIYQSVKMAVTLAPSVDNKSLTYSWVDVNMTPATSYSTKIYMGIDNILYSQDGISTPQKLIRRPIQSFSCKYNSSDYTNQTVDITIKFSDSTSLTTTVKQLNKGVVMSGSN